MTQPSTSFNFVVAQVSHLIYTLLNSSKANSLSDSYTAFSTVSANKLVGDPGIKLFKASKWLNSRKRF